MSEQSVFESAIVLLEKSAREGAAEEARPQLPLFWLSDLSTDQARVFLRVWRRLDARARRDLMSRMEEEARENFELDFTAAARVALADDDPEVRGHAIRGLWECADPKLADRFLDILARDPDPLVRASAATGLAAFAERAELGEIPRAVGRRVENGLIAVIRGTDNLEVRRRAVESIGFSSNPAVRGIVGDAYRHPEERMRCSALRAMGRTADPVWTRQVTEELKSGSPAMRAEAARACGELALEKSVPALVDLLDESDAEIRRNAIWSLGEIGGPAARRALERMQNLAAEDDAEFDLIEEALENAEFQEGLDTLSFADDAEGEDPDDWDEDEDWTEDAE
jgi:HEAT repeat protein